MLKTITYVLPNTTASANNFFDILSALFSELPNKIIKDNCITLTALQPKDALPKTIFMQKDVSFPQLYFDKTEIFSLKTKNSVHYTGKLFSLEQLYQRIKNHIVRIDHTGINIPSAVLTKEQWEKIIYTISQQVTLYKYPTGEDWPFILPATEQEFNADITHFPIGREPKFEFVYDTYSLIPTIQIDIETDFTRKETEKLFPKPYGITFPGLEQYFRTVFISHEWEGLWIRFDLRYKNDNADDIWKTGKWLVEEGGRIR